MVTTGLIVMATYLLPVAVGVGASLDRSARKAGHVPGLARRLGGAWLGAAMMAGGLVSTLGLVNALLLTSSRVPYAMAACGMAPVSLARLHLNHGTPWAGDPGERGRLRVAGRLGRPCRPRAGAVRDAGFLEPAGLPVVAKSGRPSRRTGDDGRLRAALLA
jgi:hypothetical protein